MDDMSLSRIHNSLIYYLVNMGSLDKIKDADGITVSFIKDLSQSYAA
ncbi:MAG: hypothetical protein RBQ94_00460 [Methanimicrococcus sp.]|nr:hypothetical protein [Methanimicrococcus sp.]